MFLCKDKRLKPNELRYEMRGFLINKNLSFFYWLKKRIGKKKAFKVAIIVEKIILVFGREQMGDRTW